MPLWVVGWNLISSHSNLPWKGIPFVTSGLLSYQIHCHGITVSRFQEIFAFSVICKNSDAKHKNSDTDNSAIPKKKKKKELWSASFKWKGESSYLNMKPKKSMLRLLRPALRQAVKL